MHRTSLPVSASGLVLLVAVAVALPRQISAQEGDFLREKLRILVAEGLAAKAENVHILGIQTVDLTASGSTLQAVKAVNEETGRSERFVFDESNRRVDPREAVAAEIKAHREVYGAMSPAFARQLKQMPAGELPVVIHLDVPVPDIDKTELAGEKALEEAARRSAVAEKQAAVEARKAFEELMGESNVARGAEVEFDGPFVSARLPVAEIQRIARHPRVGFVALDDDEDVLDFPTIAESLPTTRSELVHNTGTDGSGVKIAILESGQTTKSLSCFNVAARQSTGGSTNSHMTKSVAIMGNRYRVATQTCNGSWTGYAPGADIYLGNKDSGNCANYRQRYQWAKSKGANVISMSWHCGNEETDGGLHARDTYFDYWATRYPWPSIFTSAGNQSASNAYASGKGFNFFGVGNVANDGDGDRCNDAMTGSSTWKDPDSSHSDREVPEIASPGSRHDLLDTDFGGTSAATPVTASIAGLLMDHNLSLRIWPEAIRAILLATANYQDSDGADFSNSADGKDGTGLTNSLYAYYTAGRRETTSSPQYRAHDYGTMRESDFSNGFFDKTWNVYTGTTNSRIRVALTWNSNVAKISLLFASFYFSTLDADLDLRILDPDGNPVAFSSSWDSNNEFVEFTPAKTGSYTIKVRGYNVPDDFERYYGIAFTTHYDLCS